MNNTNTGGTIVELNAGPPRDLVALKRAADAAAHEIEAFAVDLRGTNWSGETGQQWRALYAAETAATERVTTHPWLAVGPRLRAHRWETAWRRNAASAASSSG